LVQGSKLIVKIYLKNLEDITILNQAEDYCRGAYHLTKGFPESERFGLTSQVQRASVSICANMAEGFYRNTNKDFIHFLSISRGSVGETIVLLKLASGFNYIDYIEYTKLKDNYEGLIKSINSLIKYLKLHARPEKYS
jgi:four helix bundle protein